MRKLKILNRALATMVLLIGMNMVTAPVYAAQPITPDEARSIAKEAYIYGFPMVDNYRILYAYFVNQSSPEYKAPFNNLAHYARVFTPEDKTVQTPNSDTPYSFIALDLRTEPFVVTVPPIEQDRYFSIQLIDAYTHNFDYIGSRTTGNAGGSYLIAGPNWKGEIPPGIEKVIRAETDLILALYRTQLFNPTDIENVKKIQARYKAEPLSEFLGWTAPKVAPPISFIKPLSPEEQKTSLGFFNVLNFFLGFCPTHPSEQKLIERFSKIGVGAGLAFDTDALSPKLRQAIAEGMNDAWIELDRFVKTEVESGKVASGDLFGTREYLKNNYLYRYAAAVLGIYGNSKQEAMYPMYRTDAVGQAFDGSKNRYTMRFNPDQLPPVNAFWSLTMYELPSSLLSANPLNRYLINSPMLPLLKRDSDGGITFYLQHESPGAEKESNWLPAPNGPFWCAMRLYWPKAEALDGRWTPPTIQKQK